MSILFIGRGYCQDTVTMKGIICFYYNSHPSQIASDDVFYALDSVRLLSKGKNKSIYAVYIQQELFPSQTVNNDLNKGPFFSLWYSIPQFNEVGKSYRNYSHIGGDCYKDGVNDIVISFYIEGSALHIPKMDDISVAITLDSITNGEKKQYGCWWYDFHTYNNEDYYIFIEINKTKTLTKKMMDQLGLKNCEIKKFLLYGGS